MVIWPSRQDGGTFKKQCGKIIAHNGWLPKTLREPRGANPRHRARVCGRAQCGGGLRPSRPNPEGAQDLLVARSLGSVLAEV